MTNQEVKNGQSTAAQPATAQSANGQPTAGGVVQYKNIADDVLARVRQFEETKMLSVPKNYSAENALKAAWLILQETVDKDKNPVLSVCSKESVANSLLKMVVKGLNPMKKQCYFIAYGKQLSMQESYMGNMAVAKRVAGVKSVVSQAVYEGDVFEFHVDAETGDKKVLKHEQKLENMGDKVRGAYAIVTREDGTKLVEVMNIFQIRKAWAQRKGPAESDTHRNFTDEMAKKTVINRALKLLINSSDDGDLFDGDETDNDGAETRHATSVQQEIATNANTEELGFTDAIVVEADEPKPEKAVRNGNGNGSNGNGTLKMDFPE